jgi:hypothetical protein
VKPIQLINTPQPEVCAPPGIKATVSPYGFDPRSTMVTFSNEGNPEVPTQLRNIALVPMGTEAHVLRMMGEVSIYSIFPDSTVERIIITLGTQGQGQQKVDVLVAVLELMSYQDGTHRIIHGCSMFD